MPQSMAGEAVVATEAVVPVQDQVQTWAAGQDAQAVAGITPSGLVEAVEVVGPDVGDALKAVEVPADDADGGVVDGAGDAADDVARGLDEEAAAGAAVGLEGQTC